MLKCALMFEKKWYKLIWKKIILFLSIGFAAKHICANTNRKNGGHRTEHLERYRAHWQQYQSGVMIWVLCWKVLKDCGWTAATPNFTALQQKIDYFVKTTAPLKLWKGNITWIMWTMVNWAVLLLYRVTGRKNKKSRPFTQPVADAPYRTKKAASGIKVYTIKCGWMDCIWRNLLRRVCNAVSWTAILLWHANQFIWMEKHTRDPKQDYCIMHGTKAKE